VKNIIDDNVIFVKKVPDCKILCKCLKDELPAAIITIVEKCVEGVQMNWTTFLVN